MLKAEFAGLLWQEFTKQVGSAGKFAVNEDEKGKNGDEDSLSETLSQVMQIALRHGWMTPEDAALPEEPLRRNEAARILHEFLRRELGEADEENWDAAKSLRDLYDCRTCVAHVAQVYCKGIMEAGGEIFGMREVVSDEEAILIARRTVWAKERIAPQKEKQVFWQGGEHKAAKRVTKQEAAKLMAEREDLLRIDVRTAGEYGASHLEGFVNLPLMKLLEEPWKVSENKERPILLGCDGGYRSEIAARCLENEGYGLIFYYDL